jgi:hypothetical protein
MTPATPERTTDTDTPPSAVVPAAPGAQGAVTPPSPAATPRGGGEGGTSPSPLRGQAFRDAVRAAESALHARQRNARGKRRPPPIAGVRLAQGQRGEER